MIQQHPSIRKVRASTSSSTLSTIRMSAFTKKKPNAARSILHFICKSFGEFYAGLASLCAVKPNQNRMCKYYGHVIRGPWSGMVPKCADCGTPIHHSSELRTANLKDGAEIQPSFHK